MQLQIVEGWRYKAVPPNMGVSTDADVGRALLGVRPGARISVRFAGEFYVSEVAGATDQEPKLARGPDAPFVPPAGPPQQAPPERRSWWQRLMGFE